MVWDRASIPSLRGSGLHLSLVPGLDGVMDIALIADLMPCGGTPRRKVVPSLLQGLGVAEPTNL